MAPATTTNTNTETYDRAKDIKEFDDAKIDVKGLVDSGITTIPRFFLHPPQPYPVSLPHLTLHSFQQLTFQAFMTLIFPPSLSNKLHMHHVDQLRLGPRIPGLDEIPEILRNEVVEWRECTKKLGEMLMELLCEGLRMEKGRLKELSFSEAPVMVGNYYPYCPEPDLTMGVKSHTNPRALMILLPNHIGQLQVKHDPEPSMEKLTIRQRQRHRLTLKLIGSRRLGDVEFFGGISFIGFTTDRLRFDDEGLETIRV
ncbi:hypothetical protein Ddye_030350 [Dipteronia dyeriana]|uniref:Isopenicillin N synthase-like Fe(2+) 2OG dioxygenase domain-containing protein n=1 Tax=Dipteronia dyeriana TaxID=168575 RepID=A0AAD9TH77_9ROSI|nr:hypothetical protein Ddye_030350 [Dipteronia dyeriana]